MVALIMAAHICRRVASLSKRCLDSPLTSCGLNPEPRAPFFHSRIHASPRRERDGGGEDGGIEQFMALLSKR